MVSRVLRSWWTKKWSSARQVKEAFRSWRAIATVLVNCGCPANKSARTGSPWSKVFNVTEHIMNSNASQEKVVFFGFCRKSEYCCSKVGPWRMWNNGERRIKYSEMRYSQDCSDGNSCNRLSFKLAFSVKEGTNRFSSAESESLRSTAGRRKTAPIEHKWNLGSGDLTQALQMPQRPRWYPE